MSRFIVEMDGEEYVCDNLKDEFDKFDRVLREIDREIEAVNYFLATAFLPNRKEN